MIKMVIAGALGIMGVAVSLGAYLITNALKLMDEMFGQ